MQGKVNIRLLFPDQFGVTVSAFHAAGVRRAAKWPHTLLATSTHDNKRSEDVRARIDVISEMPAAWRLLVRRWSRLNRRSKRTVDGRTAPSRNDEYLLYQTLIGTFPATPPDADALAAYRARIEAYMLKAAREAKVSTSWLNSNERYESALTQFVRDLLGRSTGSLFVDDLASQARRFAWYGALNSLSMSLLKLTVGGLLFMWLLWRLAAPLWRACVQADGTRFIVTLGVSAAVATVLANGLVDSFLPFTPAYVLIWTVFGLGVARGGLTGGPADADRV